MEGLGFGKGSNRGVKVLYHDQQGVSMSGMLGSAVYYAGLPQSEMEGTRAER